MTRYSLVNTTAVLEEEVLEHATIVVEDGVLTAVGRYPAVGQVVDLGGRWVLPGFIDLHVHGGGGASFDTTDIAEIEAAVDFHRRHGTTTMQASLVSQTVRQFETALGTIAVTPSRLDESIAGVHLEGPFLSRLRPGCHDQEHLLPPDPALLRELLDVAPGLVTAVTIAPELAGADDTIAFARSRGVTVGIGHSDANYAEARRAFENGVTVVTHAHQAMRETEHRAPGIIGAAIDTPDVTLELIADLVHNHPAILRMTFAAARNRVALVTDAAPAAGMPAGFLSHTGSAPVLVDERGRIVRRDADVLAGSALTMDRAVRNCLGLGLDIVEVARAAATAPAEAIGIAGRTGRIAAGLAADLVVLDHALGLTAVIRGGAVERDDEQLLGSIASVDLSAVR